MERVSPARRGFRLPIALPRIRSVGDVDKAAEKLTQALRRGDITAIEASLLMNTLESRSRIIAKLPPDHQSPAASEIVVDEAGLAALTDEELRQLLVLTQKMDQANNLAAQADGAPTEEK
jgi:wyosine [tRNA(Phe)-imidazoG37] synthetase (radical SAM superfamily)